MKKQLILVMATVTSCFSSDPLTAATSSSRVALKKVFAQEQAAIARIAYVEAVAKRAPARAQESTEEAERKESKEEAVRRVSAGFKAELQAAVEAREKRVETASNNICGICLTYCYSDNPNVVVLPCSEHGARSLHVICRDCMVNSIKERSLLRDELLRCPTCTRPYSEDELGYIEYYTKKFLEPSFKSLIVGCPGTRVPAQDDVIVDPRLQLQAVQEVIRAEEGFIERFNSPSKRLERATVVICSFTLLGAITEAVIGGDIFDGAGKVFFIALGTAIVRVIFFQLKKSCPRR